VPSFKGQYEHSIDDKGRVAFPAKLRKSLSPDAQERFTIVRSQSDKCLYLYPDDQWELVEERLSKVNSFSKKGRLVKRHFLRFAEDVSLDKQNRIAVPSDHLAYSEISSKVVFVGMGDHIEVWDPTKLTEADESLDQDFVTDIFEQVLGDGDVTDSGEV
jgi:MraZ protein